MSEPKKGVFCPILDDSLCRPNCGVFDHRKNVCGFLGITRSLDDIHELFNTFFNVTLIQMMQRLR